MKKIIAAIIVMWIIWPTVIWAAINLALPSIIHIGRVPFLKVWLICAAARAAFLMLSGGKE